MSKLVVTAENLEDLLDEEVRQVEEIECRDVWSDFVRCGQILPRLLARLKPQGSLLLTYRGKREEFLLHPLYVLDALFPHVEDWTCSFCEATGSFDLCARKRKTEVPGAADAAIPERAPA